MGMPCALEHMHEGIDQARIVIDHQHASIDMPSYSEAIRHAHHLLCRGTVRCATISMLLRDWLMLA